MAGVRFPEGARDFYLLHSVQTDSGVHVASYPTHTGTSFSAGKAAGAWRWPLTSTLPYVLIAWYLSTGTILPLPISSIKQEVLGRTNLLLSLIRHGPHWKRRVQQLFYCCVCIRYCGNVSTEPLPSNDGGMHRHTHTHRQQRELITLIYFFKIRKVG
jgi:hypothetical protein